ERSLTRVSHAKPDTRPAHENDARRSGARPQPTAQVFGKRRIHPRA
ncbi:hypothetical protein EV216_1361, partial [Rhodovulum steppense]